VKGGAPESWIDLVGGVGFAAGGTTGKSIACEVWMTVDATDAATTRRTTDAFFIASSSSANAIQIKMLPASIRDACEVMRTAGLLK
jgi:hypothetical protein